jgi:hypothetical protein
MTEALLALTTLPGVLAVLQSIPATPAGVETAVERVLATLSPQTATIYGGGALASVGGVRWLIKRAASDGTSSGTSVSTAGGGPATVSTTKRSGGKHKVAFTLPGFLPVSDGIRQVTHNEIHALELGLVVGAAAVWLLSIGRAKAGTGIVVIFVAGSLGFKRYGTKAFKTIRLEPWYGLLALGAGAVLGWSVFIMDPGLLALLGLA